MKKTWIAKLLPKDEYQEQRILYFIAEAAVLLVVFLFLYLFVNTFIIELNITGEIIGLLSFLLLVTYVTIRSISSGIEYPDVATKSRFRQEKRAKLFSSLIFGAVFLIIYIIFKGFPSSGKEIFDIVMPAVFATFFFYLFQYISLKKSYKKNKELLDD